MKEKMRENLKAPILQYFKDINFCMNNCLAYDSLNNMLDNLIDASEERPRGEWIDVNGDGSIMKCSKCGEEVCCKNNNFCPNCGADMTKRGLRAKMGLIDDAADAKPDLEYLKVGNTIYTQDDDKQGWTGRDIE